MSSDLFKLNAILKFGDGSGKMKHDDKLEMNNEY